MEGEKKLCQTRDLNLLHVISDNVKYVNWYEPEFSVSLVVGRIRMQKTKK